MSPMMPMIATTTPRHVTPIRNSKQPRPLNEYVHTDYGFGGVIETVGLPAESVPR